jgi:hypothetical protein
MSVFMQLHGIDLVNLVLISHKIQLICNLNKFMKLLNMLYKIFLFLIMQM